MNTSIVCNRSIAKKGSLLIYLFFPVYLWATTPNLAGEITAKHLSGLTYELTLSIYFDMASAGLDLCSANIEVWDSTLDTLVTMRSGIPRSNGPQTLPPIPTNCTVPNPFEGVLMGTVSYSVYRDTLVFMESGEYELRFRHPFCSEILAPLGSVCLESVLRTRLSVPDAQHVPNSTPDFLNEPIGLGSIDTVFTYDPGCMDTDGDSLTYSLLPSYWYYGPHLQLYGAQFGTIDPGDSIMDQSVLQIDSISGVITWNTPKRIGLYFIAFEVFEYRSDSLIGSVKRTLAIAIGDSSFTAEKFGIPTSLTPDMPGDNSLRFQLFPNPVQDLLHILWENKNPDEEYIIQIIGASGSVLHFFTHQNISRLSVDTSALPAGIYSLRIIGKSGSATRRFVEL